jgi:hypothetical protein
MAYNFCAVQRVSDGAYLLTSGEWGTLDFTSNYTNARFYYSDADDVAQHITGYPAGEYRVVEYWMPGDPQSNLPKSNNTLLNNIQGSLYGANVVTCDSVNYRGTVDRMVVTVQSEYDAFLSAWNSNGGTNGWIMFTQDQIDSLRIVGAPSARDFGFFPSVYDNYFAVSVRSTNSTTTSSGYRRIVWYGAFTEGAASFSGQQFQWVFASK